MAKAKEPKKSQPNYFREMVVSFASRELSPFAELIAFSIREVIPFAFRDFLISILSPFADIPIPGTSRIWIFATNIINWLDPMPLGQYRHDFVIIRDQRYNIINRQLSLKNVPIDDIAAGELAAALNANRLIEGLDLDGTNISDTGIKAIADALMVNRVLKYISLQSNNISDASIKAIAAALNANRLIEGLDLDNNNISDTGAKEIANALKVNSSLNFLMLGGNISDAGVKYIADVLEVNSSLNFLVPGSNISDAGVKYIADALKVNRSLQALHLNGDNISDAGAKDIVEALEVNRSLAALNISDDQMSPVGKQAIQDIIKDKKRIVLYNGNKTEHYDHAKKIADHLTAYRTNHNLDLERVSSLLEYESAVKYLLIAEGNLSLKEAIDLINSVLGAISDKLTDALLSFGKDPIGLVRTYLIRERQELQNAEYPVPGQLSLPSPAAPVPSVSSSLSLDTDIPLFCPDTTPSLDSKSWAVRAARIDNEPTERKR